MSNIVLPNNPGPLVSGGARSVTDLLENFDEIALRVNGQLDNLNLSAATRIPDSKLASPNNASKKLFHRSGGIMLAGTNGYRYFTGAGIPKANGSSINVAGGIPLFRWDPAFFQVADKSVFARVNATFMTNGTPPGFTMWAHLNDSAVSSPGGSGDSQVVSGPNHLTTAAVTLPANSVVNVSASGNLQGVQVIALYGLIVSGNFGVLPAGCVVGVEMTAEFWHA